MVLEQVVYERYKFVELKLPYIPGFLAFREVGFLVDLINELKENHPELLPQLILVDGNGYLHPRGTPHIHACSSKQQGLNRHCIHIFLGFHIVRLLGFGLACHLGVLTGIATIGVGKTLFYMDGLGTAGVKKEFQKRCQAAGDYYKLVGDSGTVWGAVRWCIDLLASTLM